MTRIYGHKWSSIAESDDGTWLAGLQDLTPEQIAIGLGNLLQAGTEWPPSLPEFRDYCLDKIVHDPKDENWRFNTAAYTERVPKERALPVLKAQDSVAETEREKLKDLGILK